MRNKNLLIALVSVSLLLPACSSAADIDQERKSIQKVFDKYLESVNSADVALAAEVWSQSQDISVVTPIGRFKGWDNVRDGLYVNFLQKAFAERRLRPDNLAMNVSGNVAWAVFDWTFTAKLTDGQPFSSQGWESHVYRKIDGRWVIVHLHYSAPPPPRQ